MPVTALTAEAKLELLLKLWAEQTITVRLEPGGVLLIGGVTHFSECDMHTAVTQLKELTGAAGGHVHDIRSGLLCLTDDGRIIEVTP